MEVRKGEKKVKEWMRKRRKSGVEQRKSNSFGDYRQLEWRIS